MMIGTRQVLVQLQGLYVYCHNLIRNFSPRQVGRRMLEIYILFSKFGIPDDLHIPTIAHNSLYVRHLTEVSHAYP